MSEPRRATEEEQAAATGDCFQSALDVLIAAIDNAGSQEEIDRIEEGVRLVHGWCIDPLNNIRHVHAWLEVRTSGATTCVNTATGHEGTFSYSEFYSAGQITGEIKYTPQQAFQLAAEHRHYGPWDESHQ